MVWIRSRGVAHAVLATFSATCCAGAGASADPSTRSPSSSAVSTSTTSAPAPDLKGHIVFTRAGDPYADDTVFIANANGTGEEQLTEPDHCCVRVSHDGRSILFSDGTEHRITTGIL